MLIICGYNNAINHPPVIIFIGVFLNHSQSWVVYGIVLPTSLEIYINLISYNIII